MCPTPESSSLRPHAADDESLYRLSAAAAENEPRNLIVVALYQVLLRTGWIFKTESIVMPAVLDTITGGGAVGGVLRGCLPVLNRIGHSIPPLLFSRRLKLLPRKRSAIMACAMCMASVFAFLSVTWRLTDTQSSWWMPVVFLVCYLVFFTATGIHNLSLGTLHGKLIHATRRGRLLLISNVIGAFCAVTAVAVLMPRWLTPEGGQFDRIFGFTAMCFAVASLVLLLIAEPRDDYQEARQSVGRLIASSWTIVRKDRDFRRLACVAVAFGSSLVLFPHYQALGRSDRLGLTFDNLMIWLIIQNIGTAVFSLVAGPIADRRGNRQVLRLVLLGIAAMPLAALILSRLGTWGPTLYPFVFLFIGLTPVGFKTFNNYVLELSSAEDHPRYLSTLGLFLALPLLLSPFLGWVVETINFETVFIAVSGFVFAGFLLTFRLREPRQSISSAKPSAALADDRR
jgi:hypothetical protein